MLGMAPIRVTPPARAAAVHDAKSSLCVWPEVATASVVLSWKNALPTWLSDVDMCVNESREAESAVR